MIGIGDLRDIPSRPSPREVYVKVFSGGSGSRQKESFIPAFAAVKTDYLKNHNVDLIASYLNTDQLKKMVKSTGRNAEDILIDWLKTGTDDNTIYIILSHPMQGVSEYVPCDLTNLGQKLYDGLKSRVGFPSKKSLFCPVFLQDKGKYLEACKEICNPHMFLQRTPDGELGGEVRHEIFRCVLNHICQSLLH